MPGYKKPIYSDKSYAVCKVCKGEYDNLYFDTTLEAGDHSALTGHGYEIRKVIIGYEDVDPVTEIQQVPTGRYICSGCGAVK